MEKEERLISHSKRNGNLKEKGLVVVVTIMKIKIRKA